MSDACEPDVAVEMATALRPYWEQSGCALEGYRWLRSALDRAPEPSRARAAGLASASILGFLLEDCATARGLLQEHRELVTRLGDDEPPSVAYFGAALEAFLDGDIDSAFDAAESAVRRGLDSGDTGTTAEAMALSALYAFMLGSERAEEVAARFLDYAESHGAHLLKAIALYPLGAVRWLNGDIASATSFMREAIQLYQKFDHPGMVAVCVEGLAWSAAETDPDRAATLLGAAKSIWTYSQMRLAESAVQQVGQRVEKQLRQQLGDLAYDQAYANGQELSFGDAITLALGSPRAARPRPQDPVARAGLTRRERQVAALVADGLTNREIAAELVISPRTVDAHIEHILTKLGFRTRAQIARWFSEQTDAR